MVYMQNIVINSEKMFDGHVLTKDASVLITNGIIAKVGKRGDFKGKTINTKFLLPGLIDMHMHLNAWGGLYKKSIRLFDYFNKLSVYNGVTTVRDVGNFVNNIYNFKQTKDPKPRIFSSIFLDGDKPIWGMSFIVTNEKQAKEIITVYKDSGIQWVKAYKSIRPEILKTIIKEAHSEGLKVAGDLSATSQEDAVLMGIDTLEHAMLLINGLNGKLDDSAEEIYKRWAEIDINSITVKKMIDVLAGSSTAVCPTLILSKMELFPSSEYSEYLNILFPLDKTYKKKNPKTHFTKINREKAFENILKLVKKLNDGGVRLIAGSDTGNPYVAPGFSLHQELNLLVDSGLTPTEALKTATSVAANVLGTNEIGQIKQGCKADMVLLSGDASSDINNINKITHVILDGNVINADTKDLLSKNTLKEFLPEKKKKVRK